MKKVLKWVGIVLGALIALAVIAIVAVYLISGSQLNKTYDIQPETVAIPTAEETLERGRHLAVTRGCTDCHGDNLAGKLMVEDPAFGTLYGPNLTSGQGGIGHYTDVDFVRAVRHGVAPDGSGLWIMPSKEYYVLNDDDLGALMAYLKSLPAVDNTVPEKSAGPILRVLLVSGQLPLIPAEEIDHNAPRPAAVEPGVTVEYGEYVATLCTGCHRANFAGGLMPGDSPDATPAANLTPGGELAQWTEEDFITAMRFGLDPAGNTIDPEIMPWPAIGQMTDDELQAIWLYLQSLPPAEMNQ
jgi:mono/diheme cytochrome c family protein